MEKSLSLYVVNWLIALYLKHILNVIFQKMYYIYVEKSLSLYVVNWLIAFYLKTYFKRHFSKNTVFFIQKYHLMFSKKQRYDMLFFNVIASNNNVHI